MLIFGRKGSKTLYIRNRNNNYSELNGVEKGFKATLGKVAKFPIHWGMNWV